MRMAVIMSRPRLAMDETGQFLAFKVKTTANMGAYLSTFASSAHLLVWDVLAGQYRTPAICKWIQFYEYGPRRCLPRAQGRAYSW